MQVKIKIGNKTFEVAHSIFSHILVSHSLNLHDWEKRKVEEFKGFMDNVPLKADAEVKLQWLYDDLATIEANRKVNDMLRNGLSEALQAP